MPDFFEKIKINFVWIDRRKIKNFESDPNHMEI